MGESKFYLEPETKARGCAKGQAKFNLTLLSSLLLLQQVAVTSKGPLLRGHIESIVMPAVWAIASAAAAAAAAAADGGGWD